MQLFFVSSLSYYHLISVFCLLSHYKTILHQQLPFCILHFAPGQRSTCFGGTGVGGWALKCENKDVKAGRYAPNFRVNNGNAIDCLLKCSGHTMGKKVFLGKKKDNSRPT